MIEGGKYLSFPLKTGHTLRIVSECLGQDLQGHIPLQACIAGTINLAHPTGTEQRHNFIGAYSRTWDQRHILTRL